MDVSEIIVLLVELVVFIAAWAVPAGWAVGDAQKRGQGGGIVVPLLWMFGPLSALVWLLVRPKTKLADKLPSNYDSAETAIDAAVRLEMLGDWEAATALYREAAVRWPEHDAYAQQCVRRIRAKQASAS